MTIFKVLSVILVFGLCSTTTNAFGSLGEQNDPGLQQCHALKTLTKTKLREISLNQPFWSTDADQATYLAALKQGANGSTEYKKRGEIDGPGAALIVYAAIVSHNLTLMEKYYDPRVNSYFIDKTRTTPLYWAASCNFSDGVRYLLRKGVSPNYNGHASPGPFNIALLHERSDIPNLLLEAGYSIGKFHDRCEASKVVISKRIGHVSRNIVGVVQKTKCPDIGTQ